MSKIKLEKQVSVVARLTVEIGGDALNSKTGLEEHISCRRDTRLELRSILLTEWSRSELLAKPILRCFSLSSLSLRHTPSVL